MLETEAFFQRKLQRIVTPSSNDNEFSLVSYNVLEDEVFTNGYAKYEYITDESLKRRGPNPSVAPRHIQLIKEVRLKPR